ncbi:hypothetical protein E2C01_073701 [Portunus trituberculatus]|uniref:Uncharacterized protein n=1 Tax=Portunus trituberculatus TaxID=210409 RepID=A0A5B7ICE5_PORTR|nr:hypothetical protein [Portunus trituberculatus]
MAGPQAETWVELPVTNTGKPTGTYRKGRQAQCHHARYNPERTSCHANTGMVQYNKRSRASAADNKPHINTLPWKEYEFSARGGETVCQRPERCESKLL